MDTTSILQLIGIYMVIGLFFGVMYCSDNTDEDMQVDFFYNRLGKWCEKNDISYSGLMVIYGVFLWPTLIIHIICCVVYFLGVIVYCFFEILYKIARALLKPS